jgi:hypothetical protein
MRQVALSRMAVQVLAVAAPAVRIAQALRCLKAPRELGRGEQTPAACAATNLGRQQARVLPLEQQVAALESVAAPVDWQALQ